ncbi:MAG: alpha-L-fucosidase, partial [Phocaeicola sp.]
MVKNLFLTMMMVALWLPMNAQTKTNIPTPTKAQLRWHNYERTMFIHFGPATWQHREYDNLTTPIESMNPTELDTDQWCEVAMSWGAKMILFVAKHTGGFCWWNTSTVDYNVMNTPYGKDVMAELQKSCKKYGLDMGVYVYPGDDSFGAPIGSGGITKDPSRQEEYNRVFRQQISEVLENYGTMREIWFDGNCNIDISDIIEQHTQKAVVFQGPHASIRWMGNEDGCSPDPNWYTLSKEDLATGVATAIHSTANGDAYAPTEADVPFLKNGGHKWFWAPDTDNLMMTVDQFVDLYYKSVGRGSVMLMNATPDTTGLIPQSHVARYAEFGAEIEERFGQSIAKAKGKGKSIHVKLKKSTLIDHVILQEDLKYGQRVLSYTIEGLTEADQWIELYKGTSIGHKKIDFFKAASVKSVRILFDSYKAEPMIKNVELFFVNKEMVLNASKQEEYKVGSWDKDSYNSEWKLFEVDITKYVNNIGEYELSFRTIAGDYTKPSGLEFADFSIEMYGNKNHNAIEYKNGKFVITRSQQTLDEFKTIFRVKVKS